MARIRTIKPEFWTNERVMECSTNARLMFIGMWNFADDLGRLAFALKTIKAQIFPSDEFSSDSIRGMVLELAKNGLVLIYDVDGKEYLQICGWQHQRIDKPQPGKCPEPVKHGHSKADSKNFQEHSKNAPGMVATDLILREGKGSYRKGSYQREDSVRAKRASRLPEDWVPSETDKLFALGRGLSVEATNLEATKFRNYWTAKGGQAATKTNWARTWENWILNSNGATHANRTANSRPTGHDAILAAAARAARKIVGNGDVAGSAYEDQFPGGDGTFGRGSAGSHRAPGSGAAGGDGEESAGGPVLEGEIGAFDAAAAGVSGRWRRDGTSG